MVRNSVTVPPRIIAGLRRQAVAAAPAECCGALIGVARGTFIDVRSMIPVQNTAPAIAQYRIEADTVLRLERQAACAGLQVVGFYHSHPTLTAKPSALDLELACPGYVHLIVQADSGLVRGWRLHDDRSGFRELAVTLLEGAA